MEFDINFEHIFFDRFSLSDVEKKTETVFILEKAFCNFEHEIFIDKCKFVIADTTADKAIEIKSIIALIKTEFFIMLNKSEEKIEIVKNSNPLEKAEEYIKLNYLYEDMTVADICSYCNIKRAVMDKMFVEKYGKTITEHVRYMRVKEAEKQLACGEKLEDTASLCGFGSVKTMQRAFKSIYGKTAGAYRAGVLDRDKVE